MILDIAATSDHQIAAAEALAAGARRHGVTARLVGGLSNVASPVAACWGWRNGKALKDRGVERVLVMERAYVRDRFAWVSLGWDGLNGRARFPLVEDGGDRWRAHFGDLLRPARTDGRYVLVLGQVPTDAALFGAPPIKAWWSSARQVGDRLGLPTLFRPHPLAPPTARPDGLIVHGGTLDEELERAAAVVAWNSNSLTDAALAGVPLIAGDPGAMTWPLGGRNLGDPPALADRTRWSHRMAWTQWLPDEIASGAAWEVLATAFEPGSGTAFGSWREEPDSVQGVTLSEDAT